MENLEDLLAKINGKFFNFYSNEKECGVYHIALYSYLLQKSKILGKDNKLKSKFGVPTADTMQALSIGNKGTYYKTLKDLELWGFFTVTYKAVSTFQATQIQLNFFDFAENASANAK